jgi:hypothetical protein
MTRSEFDHVNISTIKLDILFYKWRDELLIVAADPIRSAHCVHDTTLHHEIMMQVSRTIKDTFTFLNLFLPVHQKIRKISAKNRIKKKDGGTCHHGWPFICSCLKPSGQFEIFLRQDCKSCNVVGLVGQQ